MSTAVVVVDSDSDNEALSTAGDKEKRKKMIDSLTPYGFDKKRVLEAVRKFTSVEEAFSWLMEPATVTAPDVPHYGVSTMLSFDGDMEMYVSGASSSLQLGALPKAGSHVPFNPTLVDLCQSSVDGINSGISSTSVPLLTNSLVSSSNVQDAIRRGAGVAASTTAMAMSQPTPLVSGETLRGVQAVDLTDSPPPLRPKKRAHPHVAATSSIRPTLSFAAAAHHERSRQKKPPSERCLACRMSVQAKYVVEMDFCRHNVCVPCLRVLVESHADRSRSMKRLQQLWPEQFLPKLPSSSPQRLRHSPVTRRTSFLFAKSGSPLPSPAPSPSPPVLTLSASASVDTMVDGDNLYTACASNLLVAPFECPVGGCRAPISWPHIEDILGSTAWQEFTEQCMSHYIELTDLGDQAKEVWVPCPSCQQPLSADAIPVTLPDGQDISKLSVLDMKVELQKRGLKRSGGRAALLERLRGTLKRAASGFFCEPPMLRCTNRLCQLLACPLCSHVQAGTPSPSSKGRASAASKVAVNCQTHTACPSAQLFSAIVLCKRLNTVLHLDTSTDTALAVAAKKKKKPLVSTSSGIGYSGSQQEKAGGSSREADEAREREVEADSQYQSVIVMLNKNLVALSENAKKGSQGCAQNKTMDSSDDLQIVSEVNTTSSDVVAHPVLYAVMRQELLPALSWYLHNDSIADVAQRSGVYESLLDLLCSMLDDWNYLWLLDESVPDEDGDKRDSIVALLQQLHTQAKVLLSVGSRDSQLPKSNVGTKVRPPAHSREGKKGKGPGEASGFDGSDKNELTENLRMANKVTEVYTKIQQTLETAKATRLRQSALLRRTEVINLTCDDEGHAGDGCWPSAKRRKPPFGQTTEQADATSQLEAVATPTQLLERLKKEAARKREQEYVDTLSKLRFASTDIFTDSHVFYKEARQLAQKTVVPERMMRICKEVAALSTSLPLSYNSSVFLRMDDDRNDVMKALVIGPEDTPYANGLFEFDIFLPATYPNSPPCFRLVTTNHGKVRFNPNLYACGKVCLSLLGTWQGPSWDPKKSTLLQVLISIQAMILVPDPFFNEPGFENTRLSPHGKWSSENYNARIREATVRFGMSHQLSATKSIFAPVIRQHFKLKGDVISKQLEDWTQRATVPPRPSNTIVFEGGVGTSEASMKAAVRTFNDHLSLLKPIEL
ncbi:uncharacterized protein LOC135818051 [Sycon ciliatum]|uniref:uncharacterized protein LOC135818051 n=1 Tax=Sycon ciliatum TaxID=27933 RepID=UPI0031F69DAF